MWTAAEATVAVAAMAEAAMAPVVMAVASAVETVEGMAEVT